VGAVNFYLKKPEAATKRSLIYLKYKYNGKVLVFTFGQTIDPKNWDSKKQRVKSNKETTADGQYALNELLDVLKQTLTKAYNQELKNGIPEPATLKLKLIQFLKRQNTLNTLSNLYELADKFISGEIKHKGKDKAKSTIKPYKTVIGHLKAFELKERYPISFETITLEFYYKYLTYLKKVGLSQNTIAKHIQIIKAFMNEAVDLGLTSNMQFKNRKFTVSWVDSDAIYLTDKEIANIFKYDFSENKRLDQVRDLFIFGCYVGLRYSDYSNVKSENIITIDEEKFLKINTQKTGEQVIIPCNPIVLQIFNKYKSNPNQLPKALSNQKFNDYIKEVCKRVGLTQKGRLLTEPEKELWECISSHTARRSFATNLYLEGYPPIEIMKITGHKTEKSFLKYIRVSKLDAAKRLSKHIQVKWSEKLLKAVV